MPTLWLVDRTYDDKGMVKLTYATPDGTETVRTEFAEQRLQMGRDVTAAREADADDVTETDAEDVERFAAEATRMAERHDPDDPV